MVIYKAYCTDRIFFYDLFRNVNTINAWSKIPIMLLNNQISVFYNPYSVHCNIFLLCIVTGVTNTRYNVLNIINVLNFIGLTLNLLSWLKITIF